MTILVDMDDVLEQLLDGMIRYINSRYGTKTTLDDIREWELASAFPGLSREQIYSPELDPDFWKDVKPMPGADEALQKLIADGHEIYIVTASLYQTLPEKMDEALFRYPGAKPSTKEGAILMMADAIEAASRSLPEYTEQAIRDLMNMNYDIKR